MTKTQSSQPWKIDPNDRDSQLRVSDIIRYLLGLAKLHKEKRIGNIELSEGLRELAHALRPYADRRVSELASTFTNVELGDRFEKAWSRTKLALPTELKSIGQEDIERILDNEIYWHFPIKARPAS